MNAILTAPDSSPPGSASVTVTGQVGQWLETRCKCDDFLKKLESGSVGKAATMINKYSWEALPRPSPREVFYDALGDLLIRESFGDHIGTEIRWDGDAAAIEADFLKLMDELMHREVRNPRRPKKNMQTVPMSEEAAHCLDQAAAALEAPDPAPRETEMLLKHFNAVFFARCTDDVMRAVARAWNAGELDDKAGAHTILAERLGVTVDAISKAKKRIRRLLETVEDEFLKNPDPICPCE